MKRDYSEYQYTSAEKYRLRRSSTKEVQLDFFANHAQVLPDERRILITVDAYNEDIMRQEELNEFDAGVGRDTEGKACRERQAVC